MLTGDIHAVLGGWQITVRRSLPDESGDAYALCVEEATGDEAVLKAEVAETGSLITQLSGTAMPEWIERQVQRLSQSLLGVLGAAAVDGSRV